MLSLGDAPTVISTIDSGAAALAAIQGLHAQLEDKAVELNPVKAENTALQVRLKTHEDRMMQLEMAVLELLRKQILEAAFSGIF